MRYTPALLLLALGTPVFAADDAARLSARIDSHLAAKWAGKVEPAPAADDAEFFRRLCLDLTGRIPSLAAARDFLDDDRPDKRRLWADELLDTPDSADRYAAHFANYWRSVLLAQSNPQFARPGGRLGDYLRKQLRANVPYDKLVRDLFTNPDAGDYFTAYENKPENVAGATARVFLGIRLECAQCHADRSGGSWTQQQFWQYAAFFSRLPGPRFEGNNIRVESVVSTAPPRIKLPEKNEYVAAKYLDDTEPAWKPGTDPRALLAEWVTRRDNPWFARAAVNRVWHHFFGVGLVDPVDGFGADDNPPSHPELLDELSRAFVEHDFDLKFLVRAIVGTKAYQRTSRQTHPAQADPRLFARMPVRGLSAEQLFDSLVEATGYAPPVENSGDYLLRGSTSPRAKFLAKFQTTPDRPIDTHTSIQQALFLMNGKLATTAGSLEGSRTLAAVSNGSGTAADKVGQLFLVILSRKPTDVESKRLTAYVESGGPAKDPTTALVDVFWALLNSTEFAVNH
jgi:hypothetical protein